MASELQTEDLSGAGDGTQGLCMFLPLSYTQPSKYNFLNLFYFFHAGSFHVAMSGLELQKSTCLYLFILGLKVSWVFNLPSIAFSLTEI